MAHVRTSIRAALAAALTGLATTGARVFELRDTDAEPFVDSELPGLLLGWEGEDVLDTELDGVTQVREFTFTARAICKAAAGYASTIDNIAAECESAIATAASTGGALSVTYAGVTTGPEIDAGLESNVATATLAWRVQYAIDGSAPGVAG